MLKNLHVLTIDVEDYDFITCRDCLGVSHSLSGHVVKNTQRVLDILDEHDTIATFFVMGMVAERFPDLVRDIHTCGHEVASHGYAHIPVDRMTPEQFSEDLDRSIGLLEAITGQPVLGFRAPLFSTTSSYHWALDIVADFGLEYDSSLASGSRSGLHPTVHRLPNGLIEVPVSTLRILGVPARRAGGGQLRRLPSAVVRHCLRNSAIKQPLVIYFHPYELDGQGRPLWNNKQTWQDKPYP